MAAMSEEEIRALDQRAVAAHEDWSIYLRSRATSGAKGPTSIMTEAPTAADLPPSPKILLRSDKIARTVTIFVDAIALNNPAMPADEAIRFATDRARDHIRSMLGRPALHEEVEMPI